MKVLFISRAYPPVVGGIENQNAAIGRWLSTISECRIIANTRGKRWLPVFMPFAAVQSLFYAKQADVILLGDGVVTVIGWLLKNIFPGKPVVCILHGLDITYPNSIYQRFWTGRFFHSIDHFITVSYSTADIATSYGINKKQISVIPNGVEMPARVEPVSRPELSALLGRDVSDKKILLTLGRLVKRKGVIWFVKNVMPSLPEDVIYIVAGDGPERIELRDLVGSMQFDDRVYCTGSVGEKEKKILYSTSNLFIQPNIPVSGDAEGFGISVIEAGSYGLPVIAADLEGLKDSVVDRKNGWRVPVTDVQAFVEIINRKINVLSDDPDLRDRIIRFVKDTFSYAEIIKKYQQVFDRLS